MFSKLLPKEEKFFDDFREMIGFIEEMASHTEKVFSFNDPLNHVQKMKPLELQCDEVTSRVTSRLNKTYLTPFDSEDIFALIKSLDDISDMLLGATVRVETFHIEKKIDYADKLSWIIQEQVKELGIAIQDLKGNRINELITVKNLEGEADKVYKDAMRELFKAEMDAIELIKKKEILDLLEETCDTCNSTANIIQAIIIKNS